MHKEIEEIRQALIAINGLDDEAREALATLEASIDEIDRHPESDRVKGIVRETAGTLATSDEEAHRGLSGKWEDLKDSISHWEEEHPSVVLAIGRVSNSLAAFGI